MKVAVFSSKPYDEDYLLSSNSKSNELEFEFFEARLDIKTANLAQGFDGICCFVNDVLDKDVIEVLGQFTIRIIAMRCAGFNNVDLDTCASLNIAVARVPDYSPNAIAEHAVALILDLNRNIHRAFSRVRENDYSINGLMGFNLHGKVVSCIGGGKIGRAFIQIMQGFGCRVLCFDPKPSPEVIESGAELVDLTSVWRLSDIISLHCPLSPNTFHMINESSLNQMKKGVMLINTSRGALIDTPAAIQALKSGDIGYLGLDVYEEEADLFFEDNSNKVLQDDVFARLITFKNVVITGHQAFFTAEAMQNIADITISNLNHFNTGKLDHVHLL